MFLGKNYSKKDLPASGSAAGVQPSSCKECVAILTGKAHRQVMCSLTLFLGLNVVCKCICKFVYLRGPEGSLSLEPKTDGLKFGLLWTFRQSQGHQTVFKLALQICCDLPLCQGLLCFFWCYSQEVLV